MKIFRCDQIKEIDQYTIDNEPISSTDLMERAAGALLRSCIRTFDRSKRILIFTGPGNNGGDGLALARQLAENRFVPEVFNINISGKTSPDWNINYQRLLNHTSVSVNNIDIIDQFPAVSPEDIIIDSIFGSGLIRPVDGLAAKVIERINRSGSVVVSVDMPSGLFGEDNSNNNQETIVRANYTLSFQFPKLSFMVAENARFTGEWNILPIGLSNAAINNTKTPYSFLENDFVRSLLRKRNKFDHKGNFGHGLLIAGSYGKMGAAFLGAKAALKSGIGLVTCHIPSCGIEIMQASLPEAMVNTDRSEKLISDSLTTDSFDATGIGPGIGTDPLTQKAFHSVLLTRNKPIVIDADGINILGLNKKWLSALPAETVLTPHIKEFDRIAGKAENGYKRLEKQMEFASGFNCIVILKGAYSSIATPEGRVYFNSTGNPGMATAGSGDALTGIIMSFMAQGYSTENASILGVYLHGMAGDIAAARYGFDSVMATDIINCISDAFLRMTANEYAL